MRHITIAIDDETYERAERRAERLHTSVPDLFKTFLASMPADNSPVSAEEFAQLEKMQEDVRSRITNFDGGDRLSRDEIYNRILR